MMHLLSFLLLLSLASESSSSEVRSFVRRRLAEYFQIAWGQDTSLCIIAPFLEGESLELQPCEYRNPPSEQLWLFDGYQIVSRVGNGRENCMMVNKGRTVFDGVRIRLGFCQTSGLTEFTLRGDSIYVHGHDLCLTSTGIRSGAHIEARSCEPSQLRCRWVTSGGQAAADETVVGVGGEHNIELEFAGHYDLYYTEVWDSYLCAQPKNGQATHGNEIVLDKCYYGAGWYVYEKFGLVLFQSAIDSKYCLQAGLGGPLVDGLKMRLAKCGDDLQIFTWEGFEAPIIPNDNRRLCMVPQGSDPGKGALLVLKSCDSRSEEWSADLKDVAP